jgi:hypothetical protein
MPRKVGQRGLQEKVKFIGAPAYCVYKHFLEGEPQPFYIGSGHMGRPFLTIGRNQYWRDTAYLKTVRVEIVSVHHDREEAYRAESDLIREFNPIANSTSRLFCRDCGGTMVMRRPCKRIREAARGPRS